jgi:hypothetical protein
VKIGDNMGEEHMRILLTCVLVMLGHGAWAQGTPNIPVDFLAKMAGGLAALTPNPPPPNALASAGTPGQSVPSKVWVHKPVQAVTIDASGTLVYKPVPSGTQASVYGAAQNHYEVSFANDPNRYWVEQDNVTPTGPPIQVAAASAGTPDKSWLQQEIESKLKAAAAFRDAYQGNPYVNVTGFSVGLALTGPEITMQFQFR